MPLSRYPMLAVSDVRAPERSMAKAQRVTAASALLGRLDRCWRSLIAIDGALRESAANSRQLKTRREQFLMVVMVAIRNPPSSRGDLPKVVASSQDLLGRTPYCARSHTFETQKEFRTKRVLIREDAPFGGISRNPQPGDLSRFVSRAPCEEWNLGEEIQLTLGNVCSHYLAPPLCPPTNTHSHEGHTGPGVECAVAPV